MITHRPLLIASPLWLVTLTAGAQPPPSHVVSAAAPADEPVEADPDRGPTAELHDGFLLRFDWGYANLYSRGSIDTGSQQTFPGSPVFPSGPRGIGQTGHGVALHVDVGYAPVPGVVLGVALSSHLFDNVSVDGQAFSSDSVKYVAVGGLVLFYPDPTSGYNAGLTLLSMSAHRDNLDYTYTCVGGSCGSVGGTPTGFALAPQLGYEGWIGNQISLGAFLRVTFARLTEGARDETANVALTSLGIAFTYQ